jgi:hypothetical protein
VLARVSWTVAVPCSAVLIMASSAAAAPGFLPPSTVSSPGLESFGPDFDMNANGGVAGVWDRADCRDSFMGHFCSSGSVFGLVRDPGQSLPTGAPLPGVSTTSTDLASNAQVALTDAGEAVAIWTGSGLLLRYSIRPPGQGFETAQLMPGAQVGSAPGSPTLDGNAAGDVVAGWTAGGPPRTARYARKAPGGGFADATQVPGDTGTGSADRPDVAVDSQGNAIMVWDRSDGLSSTIRWAFAPAGQPFGPAQKITDASFNGLDADVEVDAQGNAVVVWVGTSGGNQVVRFSRRPAGGTFSPPASNPGQPASGAFVDSSPRLAVDPQGRATVLWVQSFFGLRYALAPPGGGFEEMQPMPGDPGTSAGPPDAATDAAGNVMALWTDDTTGTPRLPFARHAPGQPFDPAQPMPGTPSGAGFDPAIALEPGGNGVAAWPVPDPDGQESHDVPLFASGFDATPPVLTGVAIPAQGVTGQSLGFSATATDIWSPAPAISWSFGDGGQAQGGLAGHAYSVPGSYGVGVTATDEVGNSASAGGTVAVTASTPSTPAIDGLSMLRRRFAVARGPTPVSAAVRRGSAFRFRLSERATVSIAIERAALGRRYRGRCVKPRRSLRRRPRCTRWLRAGPTLVRRDLAARSQTVKFSGRIGRKALRLGRHRATLVAENAAGRRSAPRRITFTILRARRR